MGIDVTEDTRALLAERVEALDTDLLDFEQLAQALAEALLALGIGGKAREGAVGGEDGEAGVVEPGQRHQREVVRALAADLVAVGERGLVEVVAVGDQQLGIGQQLGHLGVDPRVVDPPGAGDGAERVGRRLSPRRHLGQWRHQGPGVQRAEREDRREGVARGGGASVLSEKIAERLWRVARVRSRRSFFGPGSVRSWGRTWPASKSSTRTRARMPWRGWAGPSGPGGGWSVAQSERASSAPTGRF